MNPILHVEIPVRDLTRAAMYFAVNDVAAVLTRAVAHGGTVLLPPTPTPPEGQVAALRDSEGNCIALQAENA